MRDKGNNVINFSKLNIIYGQNYSGKTTLSRVFRLLETGRHPEHYENISFKIHGDGGEVNENTSLPQSKFHVRVYNKDFISENLSFLTNGINGEIKTFAIVGDENNAIKKSIFKLEEKLGSLDSKNGLKFEIEQAKIDYQNKKGKHESEKSSLDDQLQRHAKFLKDEIPYTQASYNITSIKADISTIKANNLATLSADKTTELELLLKESELNDINENVIFKEDFSKILEKTNSLITRKIAPTKSIQDLINNALLQNWVKQGIPLHKDKRDNCGFCNQKLPTDIWDNLAAHFNEESEELEKSINECIAHIDREINLLSSIVKIKPSLFYSVEKKAFEANLKELDSNISDYKSLLEKLKKRLNERANSIFNSLDSINESFSFEKINQIISNINAIISDNNQKTKTLKEQKNKAINQLILSDVKNFIDTINYDSIVKKIATLHSEEEVASKKFHDIEDKINLITKEIQKLNTQLKDEKKGAEQVNKYLTNFFGHNELRLIATEEDGVNQVVKFQIMRGENSAFNLSEGECSLIAFCYFMAKLEDTESKGKDLIIYIDDPISSLDNNHIYFIYSMIETLITKPIRKPQTPNKYKYHQLFVSTHNLEFLRHLRRLHQPKNEHQYFLISRDAKNSEFKTMPSYLKDYVTEFNYLFKQIYLCSSKFADNENNDYYYSFGNNLRKFLESFLFYKYPETATTLEEKINNFFGNNSIESQLLFRIANEHSHSTDFDRSQKPINAFEINKVADFVIKVMFCKDKEQLNSLLVSIEEPVMNELT
ncbi:MAG: hypothetical protein RL744_1389 [Pseudomonadota bacterium]